MLRLLVGLLVAAVVAYGASAPEAPHERAESAVVSISMAATSMAPAAGGPWQPDRAAPSKHCPQLTCSQTFATPSAQSKFLLDVSLAIAPRAKERDPRSIVLDQDPPVPRPLA